MRQIPLTEEEHAYESGIDTAMFALRFITSNLPICPRCFLELLVERINTMLDEGYGPQHTEEDPDVLSVHSPVGGHA